MLKSEALESYVVKFSRSDILLRLCIRRRVQTRILKNWVGSWPTLNSHTIFQEHLYWIISTMYIRSSICILLGLFGLWKVRTWRGYSILLWVLLWHGGVGSEGCCTLIGRILLSRHVDRARVAGFIYGICLDLKQEDYATCVQRNSIFVDHVKFLHNNWKKILAANWWIMPRPISIGYCIFHGSLHQFLHSFPVF